MKRRGEATGTRGANWFADMRGYGDTGIRGRPSSRGGARGTKTPDSKRGPASLPAPVSPDFGVPVPKDHRAWFRRHAPPAPARACGFCVGHRDRGLRSRRSFRHRSSAARLETAGGSNKALLDTGSSSIPGLSQSLARLLPPKASASACAALPPEAPVRFRSPSARRLRSRLRASFGWSAFGHRLRGAFCFPI